MSNQLKQEIMIEIKGGKKEQIVREYFNEHHDGIIPRGKVLDLFGEFELV